MLASGNQTEVLPDPGDPLLHALDVGDVSGDGDDVLAASPLQHPDVAPLEGLRAVQGSGLPDAHCGHAQTVHVAEFLQPPLVGSQGQSVPIAMRTPASIAHRNACAECSRTPASQGGAGSHSVWAGSNVGTSQVRASAITAAAC